MRIAYIPGFFSDGGGNDGGLSQAVIFIVLTGYLFGNFSQDIYTGCIDILTKVSEQITSHNTGYRPAAPRRLSRQILATLSVGELSHAYAYS